MMMSGAISGLKGCPVLISWINPFFLLEKLFLTRNIKEYSFVSQAEITIDGVNDAEEMQTTDVMFENNIYHFELI